MGLKVGGCVMVAAVTLTLAAGAQAFVWPAGVRQIPVAVATGAGEGQLAGDITSPTAKPPVGGWPGAVILAGSGPTDRNGDNPGEPVQPHPYEKLAAYLSSHGVAVLRFDKRGIAASSKLHVPDSIDRYATDARWAALRLAQQPGVNASRIKLVGHSLGSTLALLAAEENAPKLPAPLAGIVSLEGSGRTLGEVLLWQLHDRLPPAALKQVQHVVNAMAHHQPVTMADAGHFRLLQSLIAQQPFTQTLMALDPIDVARRDRVPTLIVQGGKDIQVTAALDGRPLAAAIPASTPHALRVFPNMFHMLMDYAGKPGMAEYYLPGTTPLDSGMLAAVLGWIQKY